jgi:uncharacterized protein (TIGR02466 family)
LSSKRKRRTSPSRRPLNPAALADAERLLKSGQPDATLRRLDGELSGQRPRNLQSRLRAGALLQLGRLAEAEAELLRAAAWPEADPSVWAELGQVRHGLEDFDGAIEALSTALRARPDAQPWLQALGVCCQQAGNFERALDAYEQALNLAPRVASLHFNRATVLKRLHRAEDAATAYRTAHELAPTEGDLALSYGICLLELGRFEPATKALEAAIAAKHAVPQALSYLSYVYTKLGRGNDAVNASREACRQAPDDIGLLCDRTSAEAAAGCWNEVVEAADTVLAHLTGDPSSLSNKVIALVELDRINEALAISDPNQLIMPAPLPVPPGYDHIAAFNQALIDHVVSHPDIELDVNSLSCHEGSTSGEILLAPLGPLAHFQTAIESAVDQYVETLAPFATHPFVRARPKALKMTAWLTVLRNQGYQHGHIHARAWLSGVYYLSLPSSVGAGGESQDGCIEFGRPPHYFPVTVDHPVRVLRPQTGQLFMFPSFYYHRTLPFESEQPRISIAFDLDPV